MKRKIMTIFLIITTAFLLLFGNLHLFHYIRKHSQKPISMVIASDIHYLSPDYRGTYFKEPQAMFDGKLTHYSSEYFDSFLSEVLEKQPEILILSGDLTLNGSRKSHEEIIEKLTTIQAADIPVLVIPGNHDIHTTAGDYSANEPILVENISSADFMEMYENFGPTQAISRDADTFSYVYEATPYLRLLLVDTNCIRKGTVTSDTLHWIEQELKKAKAARADVIAITHQNLHIHNELLYFSYQIYNADELLALFEKYNVAVNFSGHIHVQSIVSDTSVPEVAVGSLGICGTPYGEITYDGTQINYTTVLTDVSGYAAAQDFTDENLLNFNQFSTNYFEEVGRLQIMNNFTESTLPSDKITLLADTFARINSAYFLGKSYDMNMFADGLALWQEQDNAFVLKYIETMLKEAEVDNQTLRISLD